MGRAGSIAAVALGAAVCGTLFAAARIPPSGPTRTNLEPIAAEIDARLREATAQARSRAETLAELPRLALAVATDAATVRDLTAEELGLRPGPDETIEIAQVPLDGAPVSLLRIPSSSKVTVPLASPGVHLIRDGSSLRVAAVVRVEPRARAEELFGIVAVSRTLDLRPLAPLLERLGSGVRLETPTAGAFRIGGPLADKHETIAVPLASELNRGVRLVVPAPVPGGWRVGLLVLAIATGALWLTVAALLWRRRGQRAAPRSLPWASTVLLEQIPAEHPLPPFLAAQQTELAEMFRIGRYSVLRRLGSGGMADVYLARLEGEAGFERLVALKVIHEEMVSNPKFVSHFLDEARLATNLIHPNIIAITELGQEDGKYVIAMEYVDGADLERLIHSVARRKVLVPIRVALAIVRHICDGLHFAHSVVDSRGRPLNLVHRDVKSANVFVSRTGAVKVGDFGIAKITGPARHVKTEIGEIKGTAAYMAPEQRLGKHVDRRADIYAVGAISYELLTGRVINLDFAKLAHLGQEGWPHLPAPSALRPDLPPELDWIVFCAMAFDPEARFPTCEALELALADVVDRRGLWVSDNLIARWIADELAVLPDQSEPSSGQARGGEPAPG